MKTFLRPCLFSLASIALTTLAPFAFAQDPISGDIDSPQAGFAVQQIRDSFSGGDGETALQIEFVLASAGQATSLKPEGFQIKRSGPSDRPKVEIIAMDPAGLMYGGLEVDEIMRTLGPQAIADDTQSPYMQMRGTKFNVPLDVRTPSYTDVCDAAQMNIPDMWDLDFWKEYIDTLAKYRYNYISLWSLHPFPSMVKVPEYPEIALDDVWRSKTQWKENYSKNGIGFVTEEILADVEVVKKLTIDQKIDFWRQVMAYGKSRNVDFYVVTWNIFTDATFGKYGITEDIENATTVDYFRRSVAAMIQTYPNLAGIGLTTGENMHGANAKEKEDWALAAYGQGVLDAVADQPDRKVRFIHRQHQASTADITRTFKKLIDHPNIDFIFSFKYAKAHVYSATNQPYHRQFVKGLGKTKTIWTLRNDDVYCFRWGAPDFVREFVKNIPYDVSQGYYYGSDQWVWGREFLQRDVDGKRPLEIDKHWYQWLLWGRFAYNPDVDNDRLKAIIADRFGLSFQDGANLFQAWQEASMIYPITTGFHWGPLDFQWYIEGCQSDKGYAQNETGFHDVNRFINLPPHAFSGNQSIPDFAKNPAKTTPGGKRSPLAVADLLDQKVQRSRQALKAIPVTDHRELKQSLADIKIVCELGSYYADKIRGATWMAVYRESDDTDAENRAIESLVDAARHWHRFAVLAVASNKNPLWTNRVGHVDWRKNYQHALEDIRIAGGDPAEFDLPKAVDVENEPVIRWQR
jgi:hypothetical protein